MISEAVLPFFGIEMAGDPFWWTLHSSTAYTLIFMLGVHIYMHWKWIINTFKSITFRKSSFNHASIALTSSMTKKSMLQIIIILLTGLVISYGVLLLGDTEWANNIRDSFVEQDQIDASQDKPNLIIRFGLSILWTVSKLVICAFMAFSVAKIGKLIKRIIKNSKKKKMQPTPAQN